MRIVYGKSRGRLPLWIEILDCLSYIVVNIAAFMILRVFILDHLFNHLKLDVPSFPMVTIVLLISPAFQVLLLSKYTSLTENITEVSIKVVAQCIVDESICDKCKWLCLYSLDHFNQILPNCSYLISFNR